VQEARALAVAKQTATLLGTEITNAQTSVASVGESVPTQDNTQVASVAKSMGAVQESLQQQSKRTEALESADTIHF